MGLKYCKGVKYCKGEGKEKDKITPESYFFGLSRAVKLYKSSRVMEKLPPNSYIILFPLTDQKDIRVGCYFVLYRLTLTPFYPAGSLMQPKKT